MGQKKKKKKKKEATFVLIVWGNSALVLRWCSKVILCVPCPYNMM